MSQSLSSPTTFLHTLFASSAQRYRWLWLGVTLAIAAGYGGLALQQAFASDYVVQDDARQHIFWMQRLVDPATFPHDWIADYFQSVAPPGYQFLYRIAAALGISPSLFSKVLPLFLGLLTAGLAYEISWTLLPVPFGGFIAAVSFSQSIWYSSEHASATPRAFLYPLLLAFIYFALRQQRLLSLISLIFQALFYPQIALICLGVWALSLIHWRSGRLSLPPDRIAYGLFALGFGLVAGIVLLSQGQTDFGAVVTRAEAIALPEFQTNGRNDFFGEGLEFWLNGRGGLFHERGFTPATLLSGMLLPGLLSLPIKSRWRSQITPQIWLLFRVLLASLGLFTLAHLMLFRLHLPSRYTSHTIRAILGLTCGVSWLIILDDLSQVMARCWRRSPPGPDRHHHRSDRLRERGFVAFAIALTLWVLAYPTVFLPNFPKVGYYDFAPQAKLYEYLAAQPPESLTATLSVEAGNIPSLAQRPVLVSAEHAIAYHKGYYAEFRERAESLITAQYTAQPTVLSKFIRRYGIDFWLLDNHAFEPSYISGNDWLRQYQPIANTAIQQLEQGTPPLLSQIIPLCSVASNATWTLLDAACIQTWVEKQGDRVPKSS